MVEDPRLFRFGFLASLNRRRVASVAGWNRYELGPATVFVHPEERIRRVDLGSAAALLIGEAFPIGSSTVDALLEEALCTPLGRPGRADWDLSGRFCLLLARGDTVEVGHDPFGARTIYYSTSASDAVASHAELLARVLERGPAPDVSAFRSSKEFSKLTVKYLPGDRTSFDDIAGLPPNHRLLLGQPSPQRFWPEQTADASSVADFRTRLDLYMDALADHCRERAVVIGITGGVDSRLVVAGLHARRVRFEGITFLGAFCPPGDIPLIEEIVQRLGIAHRFVDVPGPMNDVALLAGRNSGRGASRLTSALAEQLSDLSGAMFLRGYGGEILRGFYNLYKGAMSSPSATEFTRYYLSRVRDVTPSHDVVEFTRTAFSEFFKRAKYSEAIPLGYDSNDLFYWEHRMGMWGSAMLNEMDIAMKGMAGLNDRRLYQIAFGVPPKTRLTKSFLKTEADRMLPALADLPVQ